MERHPHGQTNGSQRGPTGGQGEVEGEGLARGLGVFSLGLGVAQILAPAEMVRLIGIEDDDRNRTLMRALGLRELAVGIGILTQPRTPGWAWARVGGDAMDLALLAAAIDEGKGERTKTIAATAAVAGITALDVHCATQLAGGAEASGSKSGSGGDLATAGPLADGAIQVTRAITVNRSPEEVYRFWRDFENLPRFMLHLESVYTSGDGRSRWTAKAPAGRTVSWDAEIVQDRPNRLIAWRSLPNADVANLGTVRFEPAQGDRGTEVHVDLRYAPPGGKVGATIAKLFGEEPSFQMREDLGRFKQVMETGEVTRSDGSPNGARLRQHPAQPAADPVLR